MAGESATSDAPGRTIGFWSVWALSVGTMIGSGVFLLPAVLAPYGLLSFGGWIVTAAGSLLLALVIGRLAARTQATGGPYRYARDAFGGLVGFLVAWVYWVGCCVATPAIAIAYVGYLAVFSPQLAVHPVEQAAVALALIWGLTLVSVRGVREAGFMQIAMTALKLVPLLAVVGLALVKGSPANLPALNPSGAPPLQALSATALLTMWAFVGFEVGSVPAGNVKDAPRTIPRAVVIGTLTVAAVYIAATAAVMSLMAPAALAHSTSPFADVAQGFGAWGPKLVAFGALTATAGALNGNIFVTGQMAMAPALEGLAPRVLAVRNRGDAPWVSLLLGSAIGSLLLLANYSRGLMGAYTFLLMMATLATLAPLLVSALAELRHSWRDARGWAAVALAGALYAAFAILGSGVEVLLWGALLTVCGAPVYYLSRQARSAPVESPAP